MTTLYILSGLPASGKTTLGKLLAQHLKAVYVRIDTIEQGLKDLCDFQAVGEGYRLSYRICRDNLELGQSVVADSCNPIQLTRDEWQAVATEIGAQYVNIEIYCSDSREHKRRVESRTSSIETLRLPSWQQVQDREYHSWKAAVIGIDTAGKSPEESLKELLDQLNSAL
ncbi:AAA family ATPase [Oceanospirillum beijerinckii]|uniref:AAA family ATPase n=1 Tax=Oceanospirillum beijerinckii TaxID=64976 RepID=UPI000408C421|nr:AAA family ATPase [Oceanospirillum beijerinckii]